MVSLSSLIGRAVLVVVPLLRNGAEAAGSTCYWPDGSPASGLFVCSPNNAESACCDHSDYCTTTGYCISSSVFFHYRSACTDKTWGSSSCPQGCLGGSSTNNHSFVNIMACDDTNGKWCCAYNGPCCSNIWQYPPLGQLLLSAVQVTATASGSAAAATTVTAACTTTDSSTVTAAVGSIANNSVTVGVGVGVGVGVPLGVIALVAISYAIWLHRKRRPEYMVDKKDQPQMPVYHERSREIGEGSKYIPRPLHELGIQEVYEAPGANSDR